MLEPVYLWELRIVHYIQELPFFEGWDAFLLALHIFFDELLELSCSLTKKLMCDFWSAFWQCVTEAGNPKWTFTVYFPLLFCIVPVRSLQMLMAGIAAEYLNGVLKWLMFGDRPFWYVHSHHELSGKVSIKQFPATCETGPGSPSGHVMVSAAIFYVLLITRRHYLEGSEHPRSRLIVTPERMSLWHFLECIVLSGFHIFTWLLFGVGKRVLRVFAYVVFICLVAISRLYIAAHFPHQVVFGVFFGWCPISIIVAVVTVLVPVVHMSARTFLLTAASMLGSAVVLYYSLHVLGLDPDWSISKAIVACERDEWVHVATTPWSTLIRDLGALVGLAICERAQYISTAVQRIRTCSLLSKRTLLASLISLAIIQALDSLLTKTVLPLVASYSFAVYAFVFVANIVQLIIAIRFIPSLFMTSPYVEPIYVPPSHDTHVKSS